MLKTITKTLAPNVTEVTFTDEDINNNSIIEVYTNDPMNVYPVEQSQSGNTVTIKVNPHSDTVGVKIFINNTNDFSVMDNFTTDNPFYALSASRGKKLKDDFDELDQWVYDVEESLNDTISVVNANSEDIEYLKNSKQNKLIAGDNITIENNVISSTGGGGGGYTFNKGDRVSFPNGIPLGFGFITTANTRLFITIPLHNVNPNCDFRFSGNIEIRSTNNYIYGYSDVSVLNIIEKHITPLGLFIVCGGNYSGYNNTPLILDGHLFNIDFV